MRPLRAIQDALTTSWPVIARIAGLGIGGVELAVWAIEARTPDSSLLTFAGALILGPNVAKPEKPKPGTRTRRR